MTPFETKTFSFLSNEQYQKINRNPNIKIKKLYDYIENVNDLPKYDELDEYNRHSRRHRPIMYR